MDPISVLSELLYRADNSIKTAERGIVYLDEFDKLAKCKEDNTFKDVTGEGVQQELLKIVEGNNVEVPINSGGKRSYNETARIDTSKILFICGGAFEGIDDVIRKRLKKKEGLPDMGFGDTVAKSKNKTKEYNDLITEVTTEDLKQYGIIPEMLGRLPIISPMKQLTEEQLVEILTKPKNAIVKQYKELFKMDNAMLTFHHTALLEIAKDAIKRKTGARGLRAIMEKLLNESMYTLPKKKEAVEIIFTDKCITEHKNPEIKKITVSPKEDIIND